MAPSPLASGVWRLAFANLVKPNQQRSLLASPTALASVRIVLVDAAGQVLPPFGATLGEKTKVALERLGIEVRYERFERETPITRGSTRGGLCRIRGRSVVLIDESLAAAGA